MINTQELSNKISNNPELLLESLKIDYELYTNKAVMACPIHNGDNPGACVIKFPDDGIVTWNCYTHHCEKMGRNIFKFVQFLLDVTYNESIKYCNDIYNSEKHIKPKKKQSVVNVSLPKNICPSNYFLSRGFKVDTLKRYEVGFCYDKKSTMFGRHICPIYDSRGVKCVGITGRTIWEKCEKCKSYHNPQKTCTEYYIPKWIFSKGVSTNNIMYNYHFAKPYILKEKSVILVEGQSDIWRLYESGVYNCLGLLGGYITKNRALTLKKLNVKRIILLMDNDESGESHSLNIKESIKGIDLTVLKTKTNDVGEMSVTETRNLIYGK